MGEKRLHEITATAFGGCDMMLMLGDKCIAELQAVIAKEAREMAPIYTVPNRPLREHVGIAGRLVFVQIYDEEACNNDERKTIEIRYYSELYGGYRPCYITEVDILDGNVVIEKAIPFVGKEIIKGEINNGSKRE